MSELMNIYARKGDKIVFKHPGSGYDYDQETARKYLTVGSVYIVERTVTHSWSTEVFLQEVPNISFNSVLFEDQPRRLNM